MLKRRGHRQWASGSRLVTVERFVPNEDIYVGYRLAADGADNDLVRLLTETGHMWGIDRSVDP